MLSPSQAQDRAAALIDHARRAGADAADAIYAGQVSEAVQVRLGALEDVERSESERLTLRVFVGNRSASAGTSDLSYEALSELAARSVAMARLAPEDRYAGLAPQDRLASGPLPDLDLIDPADPGPQALRELALAVEDAARAVPGVTNSEGGSASAGASTVALVTSHGFAGAYGSTSRQVGAAVIAGEGPDMQRDQAWRAAHHLADLPAAEVIGRQAGERTLARLNPGRVRSGVMPVVFDPRVGGSLISHLIGAFNGGAIARRSSFLLGRDGERIFPSGITIIDDPLRRRALGARPFDGEGLPTARRELIRDGRLTGWLMDSASARQLGQQPSGHAMRGAGGAPGAGASTVHLAPGSVRVADLIADIAEGVLITELIGQGVNPVTGDYSRGALGLRIVNGQLAGPVAEFTVAGNLLTMFATLRAADDLEWHRSINVPTLRIDGMTVAGD